jgi:glycosyltransferase involved in cell wall biosynthesis
MQRLIWLTENYFPRTGGMAQSCDRIVYHLRQAGVYIDVIHLTNGKKNKYENVYHGTNLHFSLAQNTDTPTEEAHSLQMLWNEILRLQSNKTEKITHLVCFGGYIAMTAAPIFAAWLDVPLVVMLRGNDFDMGIFSPKKREVLDFALQKATHIACVTKEKTEKVQKLYPQKKVIFTPNGIDSQSWQVLPSDKQKAQIIRQNCLQTISTTYQSSLNSNPEIVENKTENAHQESNASKKEKRMIGIFGQLKAKKGVLFFMEALQKTSFAEQIHLLIVGEMETETQAFLANETLRFSYTHSSFQTQFALVPYYLACDIVAIPSFYDGMPNVLLEAGSLAMSFIAADAGGMPDVLTDRHAFLFQAGNLDSCVEALYRFWDCSIEILQAKGKYLQAHIHDNFSHLQERNNYMNILEQMQS